MEEWQVIKERTIDGVRNITIEKFDREWDATQCLKTEWREKSKEGAARTPGVNCVDGISGDEHSAFVLTVDNSTPGDIAVEKFEWSVVPPSDIVDKHKRKTLSVETEAGTLMATAVDGGIQVEYLDKKEAQKECPYGDLMFHAAFVREKGAFVASMFDGDEDTPLCTVCLAPETPQKGQGDANEDDEPVGLVPQPGTIEMNARCDAGVFTAKQIGTSKDIGLRGFEIWFEPDGGKPLPMAISEFSEENDRLIENLIYAGDINCPEAALMFEPESGDLEDPVKPVPPGALPQNTNFNLCAVRKLKLTGKDVANVMDAAIDYISWASDVEVLGEMRGEFVSEEITRGGVIRFFDAESDDTWDLDLEKFLKGFRLWVEKGYDHYHAVQEDGTVDCINIDGPAADAIVQLALFDELVFD